MSEQEDFDAAFNQAVAASNEEPTAEVEAVEEAPPDQEETTSTVPEKFQGKNVEDVVGMYTNLEQMASRQGQELGELRQQLQQVQQQAYQQPQQIQFDEEAFDELVDEDPERAVMQAIQFGDAMGLDKALEAWYDVSPRRASKFEIDMRLEAERQQWQAQVQPALQPLQQHYASTVMGAAYKAVNERHPDFGSYTDQMMEIAKTRPRVLADLEGGDPAILEQTIEDLYYLARRDGTTEQAPPAAPEPPLPPGSSPNAYVASGTSANRDSTQSAREKALMDYFLAPDPREKEYYTDNS